MMWCWLVLHYECRSKQKHVLFRVRLRKLEWWSTSVLSVCTAWTKYINMLTTHEILKKIPFLFLSKWLMFQAKSLSTSVKTLEIGLLKAMTYTWTSVHDNICFRGTMRWDAANMASAKLKGWGEDKYQGSDTKQAWILWCIFLLEDEFSNIIIIPCALAVVSSTVPNGSFCRVASSLSSCNKAYFSTATLHYCLGALILVVCLWYTVTVPVAILQEKTSD